MFIVHIYYIFGTQFNEDGILKVFLQKYLICLSKQFSFSYSYGKHKYPCGDVHRDLRNLVAPPANFPLIKQIF